MATIELVEKLRQKANVTYEEAKEALEASGDNILDAMIYLERQGKVKPPQNGGYYSSKSAEATDSQSSGNSHHKGEGCRSGETFSELIGRFFRWCGRMIQKGNKNYFEVRQKDKVVSSVPVTLLALLLIVAFWFVVPLLILGLFLGYRYYFKGPDLEATGVNRVMNSAANAAENFKNDVKGSDDK
jgi:hypothetical protein